MARFTLEHKGPYNIYFQFVDVGSNTHSMTFNKKQKLITCGCGVKGCVHKEYFKATFPDLFK